MQQLSRPKLAQKLITLWGFTPRAWLTVNEHLLLCLLCVQGGC
uniref:Uncharacterized protein n=1 Tax=Anguilla anguilla TaxID=7936 RepID=A0A0E9XL58_ANGAN